MEDRIHRRPHATSCGSVAETLRYAKSGLGQQVRRLSESSNANKKNRSEIMARSTANLTGTTEVPICTLAIGQRFVIRGITYNRQNRRKKNAHYLATKKIDGKPCFPKASSAEVKGWIPIHR
jgi:hypothetical protein